jgi:6,7-dimethyl-8-ribityllumazine synthase
MLTKNKKSKITGQLENLNIYIVISRFNEKITKGLLGGAEKAFREMKLTKENIRIIYVPGSFEIPVTVKKICLINSKKKICDGILTLGCIIKGETAHFEYISGPVSYSLNNLSHQFSIPIGFGILTCFNKKQAIRRSLDDEYNKGYESALSLIEIIDILKRIK